MLWNVPCATQGNHFSNRRPLGHLLRADSVLSNVRSIFKGRVFFKRRSFGRLLGADAVWSNVRCVLQGAIVSLVSRWEHNLSSFRCVAGRTLCTQGENVSTRRRAPSLQNTAYVPQRSVRHEEMTQRVSTLNIFPLRTQRTAHNTASAMETCANECLCVEQFLPVHSVRPTIQRPQ